MPSIPLKNKLTGRTVEYSMFFSLVSTGVVIGFELPEYSTSETLGTVEVTVLVVEGFLSRPIEVTLTTADGTASGKYTWV